MKQQENQLEKDVAKKKKELDAAYSTMRSRETKLAALEADFEHLSIENELKRLSNPRKLVANENAQAEARKLLKRSRTVVGVLQDEYDALLSKHDEIRLVDLDTELTDMEALGRALNAHYADMARDVVNTAFEINKLRGEMARLKAETSGVASRTGIPLKGHRRPARPFALDGYVSAKGLTGNYNGPARLEALLDSRPQYSGMD